MSTRYAIAIHRIKGAERSQDPSEQLSWAGNEMASILREGDSGQIEPPIGWAGLAMVHKAQHEIASTFETERIELKEVEERAIYCLTQVSLVFNSCFLFGGLPKCLFHTSKLAILSCCLKFKGLPL